MTIIKVVKQQQQTAWQLWLSQTHVDSLERAQNRCLRLITTQALCAPIEALRAESELGSMQATISANILRSGEKGLRLPNDHPRRLAFLSRPLAGRVPVSKPNSFPALSPPSLTTPAPPHILCRASVGQRPVPLHCPVHPSLPAIANRRDSISTIKSAEPVS